MSTGKLIFLDFFDRPLSPDGPGVRRLRALGLAELLHRRNSNFFVIFLIGFGELVEVVDDELERFSGGCANLDKGTEIAVLVVILCAMHDELLGVVFPDGSFEVVAVGSLERD
mgnify:CR=1 FL=1